MFYKEETFTAIECFWNTANLRDFYQAGGVCKRTKPITWLGQHGRSADNGDIAIRSNSVPAASATSASNTIHRSIVFLIQVSRNRDAEIAYLHLTSC